MVWRQAGFLANLPTHATRASRSPRFRPCSLKYAKITPVLQAIKMAAAGILNVSWDLSLANDKKIISLGETLFFISDLVINTF